MSAVAAARLLAAGAAWRLTGAAPAGRALLAAVTRGRETERTLGAMMLVQAGDRSVPLVAGALLAGSAAPALVDVLASIGTVAAGEALRQVAQSPEPGVVPPVRDSAAEALRTLDEIEGRDGDS